MEVTSDKKWRRKAKEYRNGVVTEEKRKIIWEKEQAEAYDKKQKEKDVSKKMNITKKNWNRISRLENEDKIV